MSLTKEVVIDLIGIREQGQIEVRQATRILEDGVEVAKQYHRHVLAPGESLAAEDTRVAAVAKAVWTPEVVTAYKAAAKAASGV